MPQLCGKEKCGRLGGAAKAALSFRLIRTAKRGDDFENDCVPPRLNEGPVMYWYSWTCTTLIGATVVGFLATLLPEDMTKRIPLFLVWLLPLLAIPVLVWSLMPFWTK